ncbi:MAG: hypothetical protein L0K41_01600 [Yaniella sp.]|uniref:hypothetical protein n=1 Tax=Yaniella sp. TaxID=2773929 RepID=UPI0026493144|nr:hypothetical protein [Yaniella sp.]MDN5703762.1 hypothetical protein [Yaniella sp.]MDN5731233.1 hypothetical protein [Yaniella sp.]MDN5814814.1 hypothetical protein [Yaniella sp.]MDN5818406.1 hypothetical protein [Yaniella sp.]MDN5838510.1 hypothetical protein [Yaniella sp.]
MADSPKKPRGGFQGGIKIPLVFSFVVGIIAFVVATIVGTGGLNNPEHPLRLDIGLIAFGIGFAATLVVVALLQLTGRENPDHISEGSGMNRSSEELHRAAVARARERMRRERAEAEQAEQAASNETFPEADDR